MKRVHFFTGQLSWSCSLDGTAKVTLSCQTDCSTNEYYTSMKFESNLKYGMAASGPFTISVRPSAEQDMGRSLLLSL